MKKLLFFLLLITSANVDAQNYQCLQTGVKRYFIDSTGYLRGMRVDSVRTQGSNNVYYPFHTLRGIYDQNNTPSSVLLDSNGGSWLGKHVIEYMDGTFVFDNLWNDSTIIKSKANVGESWIFYHDTSNLYYLATVTEIDSMTVLGSLDSVKKITLHAYNGSSINYNHPLNNYQIFISKIHGFVKIFDLYTFPYHQPDTTYIGSNWHGYGYDYYLDHTGVQQFSLINFINPTDRQLYDYNVGDIYEYQYEPQICITLIGFVEPPQVFVDTITYKAIFPDSTVYNVHVSLYSPSCYACTSAVFYSDTSYIGSSAIKDRYLIDTTHMPEEASFNTNHFYNYYPNDTTFCYASPAYEMRSNNLYGHYFVHPFEQPNDHSIYKIGLGRIAYENYFDPGDCFNHESDYLTFYHKITNNCGNYGVPTTGIDKIELAENQIVIYPTPINDILHIDNLNETTHYRLFNMLGINLQEGTFISRNNSISTQMLPSGIYLLQLVNSTERVSIKQIFKK